MIIKNRDALVCHGNSDGREVVLDIVEAGIAAADPYDRCRHLVRLEGDELVVGDPLFSEPPGQPPQTFDLREVKHIYVAGGGKAVQRQARALEDVLGDRITEGHICIKKGEVVELKRIGVTLAGHPSPDADSVAGASKVLGILKKAGEGDIVFWLQSGGGTALLTLPSEGITLEDVLEVNRLLYFGAGASMPEANSVRNLITVLNMKEAKYVRGATLLRFIADEIPAGTRGHAFGTYADPALAYDRAVSVLEKYNLWDRIPASVREFILRRDPAYLPPTEDDVKRRPYYRYRVIDPHTMLAAAHVRAKELGLNSAILATGLNDVAAADAGGVLAEMAIECELFDRPFSKPCAFICGGEVVVAVGKETGRGGRNQELVLGAAQRIAGSRNVVIASVDSDGTDGPTMIAGGIVDGTTLSRCRAAGLDVSLELRRHNSSAVLERLGDAVITGNTGTNLRDLRVVYVSER